MVRDDAENPDPGFAELYASLPDAADLEPWLGWCRSAGGAVLYLGVGAGRLAVPLSAAGVEVVGWTPIQGCSNACVGGCQAPSWCGPGSRLDLGRRFPLVMGASSILADSARLAVAARHSSRWVAMEMMNPHWLLAAEHPTVRVLNATHDHASIEVDYPGGWTQSAAGVLRWPEDAESFIAEAGLELEVMRGRDPEAGLSESPTYFVLASRWLRSAQTPST